MERVTDPDGAPWTVVRRWAPDFGPPRWRGRRVRLPSQVEDLGGDDLLALFALIAAVVALALLLAFVAVPLLFFGAELVGALVVAAGGLAGRLAFGHPWTIEARRAGVLVERREVAGWGASRAAVADLAAEAAAGRVRHAYGPAPAPPRRVRLRALLAVLVALVWGGGLLSLVALALVPGLRRDGTTGAVRVLTVVVVVLGVAGLLLGLLMILGLVSQGSRPA